MNVDPIHFLSAAAVVAWFAYRAWRGSRSAGATEPGVRREQPTLALDSTPDSPLPFGYKSSWLAVQAQTAEAVAEAAGITDLEPANWRTGIAAAYGDAVFLTPPVRGWVLLLGLRLPELDPASRAAWDELLRPFAASFPQVCYFGSHRIVGYNAWARFSGGRLVRAFSYLGERGEILVNEGAPTPEEIALGHAFSTLPAGPVGGDVDEDLPPTPEEEDVLDVAAAWSVSPLDLPETAPSPSRGWISRAWPRG